MKRLYLFSWVSLYAIFWTIATTWLDPTVPYDAIEALNWAQNAHWGSPKNPWLVGMIWRPTLWLTEFPMSLYWYSTHFAAIAIGMLGCWYLAKYLSGNEKLAWLALLTLNLSGIINFDIISYNDNYLLIMLWPWMFLFFYFSITRHPAWWLLFSLVAGLGMMAKYSTFAFVFAVFIATLVVPKIRSCYRSTFFYLAIVLCVCIVIPNILWLWDHNFAAVDWVDSQIMRQFNPKIIVKLISIFYPLLFLLLILHHYKLYLKWPTEISILVIIYVAFLPQFFIWLWFLFHHGGRLTEWLQPFFIIAPPIIVACVRNYNGQSFRKAFLALFATALLFLIGYISVLTLNISNSGHKMQGVITFSQKVEAIWQKHYNSPFKYVGGDYLSEWVTFYASSRPQVITRWDENTQPNIYNKDIEFSDIQKFGALIIGHAEGQCENSSFTKAITQWPQLKIDHIIALDFQKDKQSSIYTVCVGLVNPV
ncbi:TPA: glycosyltransferase, partial [Enterobacter cloacae]|uniref:glycosyltransferase family 39 protein n=1 Tax=Enterobacter TaxID=547 RepID=UPI000BA8CFE8|nr:MULTISPECIES: glycosyltransferase family 39 protein [Enterobacter]PAN90662.1 glycosyltransferase [Enterobacter cloacae]MDO2448974.1 glycosyltransferase family 39 protein [Enterobacter vonholyi]PAO23084.1 glycosyltransferase [Enterobacter roggenkampii]WFC85593.1 glycosyltransferase family 39 protein [Enterobacter roggenkampii]HAS1024312.1 glycosyltransferase [Enterobacter cloacae]